MIKWESRSLPQRFLLLWRGAGCSTICPVGNPRGDVRRQPWESFQVRSQQQLSLTPPPGPSPAAREPAAEFKARR